MARHKIPTIYFLSEFVEAGGLMSYRPSAAHLSRSCGPSCGTAEYLSRWLNCSSGVGASTTARCFPRLRGFGEERDVVKSEGRMMACRRSCPRVQVSGVKPRAPARFPPGQNEKRSASWLEP
jgi:hypothetical protein